MPPPVGAFMSMRPSCAFTILRTIASPSPVPCGLVVKNGLKIRVHHVGRHARAVVDDVDLHHRADERFAAGRRLFFRQLVASMRTAPLPFIASNALITQVREELPQLMRIALNRRRSLGHGERRRRRRRAARGSSASAIASLNDVVERHVLDLQPDRPHELQHLEDDGVGHLRFLDDVAEDGLRVLRLGQLALEDARHDLDAGERILDLVRDGRRHLAEGGEAIAQPLALLELFDARQVLEEERGAGDPCRARPGPARSCSR